MQVCQCIFKYSVTLEVDLRQLGPVSDSSGPLFTGHWALGNSVDHWALSPKHPTPQSSNCIEPKNRN